jgi:hypothetical protein
MPKFCVQTYARIYLGGIEVEANSYHSAIVKAERDVRREIRRGQGRRRRLDHRPVHRGRRRSRRGSTFATVSQVAGVSAGECFGWVRTAVDQ